MKLRERIAVGVLASMPLFAIAQEALQQTNPVDPNAPVPASAYESAFKNYSPAKRDEQASPDKAWRAANDQVAKSDAHAGHSAEPVASVPATPAPASPVDHSKHH